MSRRRPLLFAATGALLLTSCGAATDDTTATAPAVPDAAAPATTPVVSAAVPAGTVTAGTVPGSTTDTTPEILRFSAPLVGGGTFDGASVAGTPVAFWFWAPT